MDRDKAVDKVFADIVILVRDRQHTCDQCRGVRNTGRIEKLELVQYGRQRSGDLRQANGLDSPAEELVTS